MHGRATFDPTFAGDESGVLTRRFRPSDAPLPDLHVPGARPAFEPGAAPEPTA